MCKQHIPVGETGVQNRSQAELCSSKGHEEMEAGRKERERQSEGEKQNKGYEKDSQYWNQELDGIKNIGENNIML